MYYSYFQKAIILDLLDVFLISAILGNILGSTVRSYCMSEEELEKKKLKN